MITPLITRPCTLHLAEDGPRDDMGDPTIIYTDAETVCELQQSTATEIRDGALWQISKWSLYLKPGETVAGWDEITIDGIRYALEGRPWEVRHPRTAATSHIEAQVREVT